MLSELSNAAELTYLMHISKENAALVKQHMLKGELKEARNARNRVNRAAKKASLLAQKMSPSVPAAKNAAKVMEHAVRARKFMERKYGRFTVEENKPRKFGRFTINAI